MNTTRAREVVEAKSGVPYPGRCYAHRPRYPWATMEVGQHFVFAGTLNQAHSHTAYHRNKYDQQRIFKAATLDGAVMVWRIK